MSLKKFTYEKLHQTTEFLGFCSIYFAVFYGFIWVYRAFSMPYEFFINSPIEWLPSIVRGIMRNYTTNFQGQTIDMSYVVLTVILAFGYVFFAQIAILYDNLVYESELAEIRMKKEEENSVNRELQRTLKYELMQFSAFIIFLELHFDYTVDPNILKEKMDIKVIKEESCRKILNSISKEYKAIKKIKGSKMVFMVDNFELFDNFLLDLLGTIKKLYASNRDHDVETAFTLSCDIVKSLQDYKKELSILEKIATFNYKGKIVVTTAFSNRYNYKQNQKFYLRSMGLSRFFEKKPNGRGGFEFISEDFDLYSLKLKTVQDT
jgi:hypothetical protein